MIHMQWRCLIPILLTWAAMLCGLASLISSAAGEFIVSARFIMVSMVLDGLDGVLARKIHGTSEFGAELDTFVDMTSFGVAPALLAWQACWQFWPHWIGMSLAGLMVLSGASRLSRFRIMDPFRGQKGYLGLPITCAAGWVTMFTFIDQTKVAKLDIWLNMDLRVGAWATFVWGFLFLMLLLQVSHVRYTKPTKNPVFFLSSIALVCTLFLPDRVAMGSALVMCAFGFYYAMISPWISRSQPEESKPAAAEPS